MRVDNVIPLGCSRLLPVDTVNVVQTLKVSEMKGCNTLTMNSVTMLMAPHNTDGFRNERLQHTNHELCHHADDATQH
jgi:hypothetical protein